MRRILVIFGTRPEAIKMAPLVKALEEKKEWFETYVAVTAQHREMLDQVLEIFKIHPQFDLNIMKERQTLTDITIHALKGLEKVIEEVHPDLVLVHGDTTTTFAGSLAAYYHQVAVGHVEAGLRTYNKYSPYPEEMNRQLTGVMADLHFAPTETAAEALLKENKPEERIFITGNTVIDALKTTVRDDFQFPVLETLGEGERLLLMTAHRRENLGEPMKGIFRAVRRIIEEFPDIHLVYPVHLNPLVQEAAQAYLGNHPRIHLIPPLDAIEFQNLMARSHLILTDSGGVQEEAPALGKPVIVLRDTTERPEGIKAGTLLLAGTKEEEVYRQTRKLLTDEEAYRTMAKAVNPYGDGRASERITRAIAYSFGLVQTPPQPFHPSSH
ncbi:non-hydrolyzing UDP-N-acetylglucosamine 2-epimerase [Thermicanus aegyptius]|uniref:non-hydrolyzing UDP-N-acetylglucosamine 2-epimerase n=1 Tax=Thermicanus aegyptius TaxID=94009 RepID=UPI00040B1775|nr:UDP-N-acetylglucosamine 2-epimerase (non-hydrolyzing) [Thermicanus aegyptius]